MTKKAFVAGWPISHSKSPLLHGFWLKEYGIEGSYEALPVSNEAFETFLNGFGESGYSGGNITIPHKEKAFQLLENLDEAAKAIGAVNTIWIEEDKVCGSNTDAYGFAANLDDHHPEWRDGKTALVIGAGGASRAIIHALLQAGFDNVYIANRTVERAKALAKSFGQNCYSLALADACSYFSGTDLVVNTTSIGMKGETSEGLPDLKELPNHAIVTDIVYTPLQTPFLKSANSYGLKTVDGLGMLLHQAVPGFEKWFGHRPAVTKDLREFVLGEV
ncbi:MAG: shikimate dehydrogenase [Pseudomonadota bacterium]